MRCTVAALLAAATTAQMPGMDQMPKKPKPSPLTKDVKFIKCQTCEIATAKALEQVKALLAAKAPPTEKKRRFDHSSDLGGIEASVEDVVSALCNSEAKEGSWMADYDIVKRGSALKLENQVGGDVAGGHCRRECRTIEKACADVVDSVDELGEYLLEAAREGKSTGTVAQRVCTKMAGVCKKGKTPPWPEGKVRKNEQFKPKTKKDKETDELMANLRNMPGMEGQGLSMMSGSDLDLGDGAVDDIDVLKDEL
jgi:hypothetical protein